MYVNKCIKCGREFETKNPKRVICPDCLYPDKNMMISSSPNTEETAAGPQPRNEEVPRFYSAGGQDGDNYSQPQRQYNNPRQGGYNRPQQGGYNRGGYSRPQSNYQRPQQGGYNRPPQSGYQRPQQGGYNRGPNNNFGNRRPQNNRFNNNRRPNNRRPKEARQLLINKDQLAQIELLYKMMLPLPNPDAHEVIGEKIGLEPRKVFFGINLVRQKLMLPKLPYPKRKLAISPDQLYAIKNLYEPLLPLPPIGCHKIIAAQLKMDEWRVHVGIGLIRSQMGLERWNTEREDVPIEQRKPNDQKKVKTPKKSKEVKEAETNDSESVEQEAEAKPKRGRKKKVQETDNAE
jgi:hypothetical protein